MRPQNRIRFRYTTQQMHIYSDPKKVLGHLSLNLITAECNCIRYYNNCIFPQVTQQDFSSVP